MSIVAGTHSIGFIINDEDRAFYKVYQLTEQLTKRLLLRAQDVILEVG